MPRVLFLYWGRRGFNRFVEELADVAPSLPGLWWRLSVSRQNERFERYRSIGDALLPVDTFGSGSGALTRSWRVPVLRRTLADVVRRQKVDVVVTMMPHVWSPFIASAVRRAGARYMTVMHDAAPHPGDLTGVINRFWHLDARRADRVVTLSRAVRDQLVARGVLASDKVVPLFMPWLGPGTPVERVPRVPGGNLRLLFVGRIMAYKGLSLLVEALEQLRAEGLRVDLSVMGQGQLGTMAERLARLGARVDNRWLTDREFATSFATHDAAILSYTEASQSGVASAALGAGLPVIALPTGGLSEQVIDGETGIFTRGADPEALADAIRRLVTETGLHDSLVAGIRRHAAANSMRAFLERLVAL